MILLGRKRAAERIVSFLIWVAEKILVTIVAFGIDLPMSRTDIADYLGLSTETLSRELTKPRQAGLIDVPLPQRIPLLRQDALREIVRTSGAEINLATDKFTSTRWHR